MVNGQRSGLGTLKTPNSTYEGGWSQGKKEGDGKETLRGGDIFTARFLNGGIVSNATIIFSNGDKYVGEVA